MRKKVRIVSAALCLTFLAGLLGGCRNEEPDKEKGTTEEIRIPAIFTVDPSTGKKNEEKTVEAFNREYEGKYVLDVEWIMETEEEYRQNLKRLNVTDELPAVITDLRMLPSYYQMMIADDRIMDLAPYLNQDQEWMNMIEPVVLEGCTEEDGSVYLSPLSTAVFSCSGVFWNEELFRKAGITEFPQTWEEFWDCCDRLKDCGITPLALHTEGTGWAPMLLATAEAAEMQAGAEFMKEWYPDTYCNEVGLHMAETLSRLFQYTTDDALHTDFDVAYTNFCNSTAAMLPNGYWMIDQIPEEMQGKIRFSPFPGNKLISSPETFGWSVVNGYSEEIREGAVEFLKFRTKQNQKEKEELFGKSQWETGQLVQDYIAAYNGEPQIVPNYQVKWNSILQEETLGEYLPLLVQGKMSPEEFVQMEDESIRRFREEQ